MVLSSKFHLLWKRTTYIKSSLSQCMCYSQDCKIVSNVKQIYSLNRRNFENLPKKSVVLTSVHHNMSSKSEVQPYQNLNNDLNELYDSMRKEVSDRIENEDLKEICIYYLMKPDYWAFVPRVSLLVARALNCHLGKDVLYESQRQIVMIIELLIVSSVMYDDTIERSKVRKGIPGIGTIWGSKECILACNMVLNIVNEMAFDTGYKEHSKIVYQCISDLIVGEFLQWNDITKNENLFDIYLDKSYKKFASPPANACKAVAIAANAGNAMSDLAFNIGRELGMAFQVMDDLLDFTSTVEKMGKSVHVDMQEGLATAPVLFACQKRPELLPIIMRRFKEDNDKEKTLELIHETQSFDTTRDLIKQYTDNAKKLINTLKESPYQKSLLLLCDSLVENSK